MIKQKLFVLFTFLLFFQSLTFLYSQGDNEEAEFLNVEILQNKIKSVYQNLSTYESLFKDISKKRVVAGRFLYEKPNSMQITFFKSGQPNQEIYFTEKRMTIFIKDLNLICEQVLEEKEDIVILDKFDFQNWEEEYYIDYKENFYKKKVFTDQEAMRFLVPKKLKAYHLTLHPKDVTKGLKSLEFWVMDSGAIIRSRSISLANQIKDIYFYNIKINKDIPSIKFIPPIDAQVVQNHLWK